MRVLVTGLDGFTGQYLKEELEKHGHQVIGLTADLTDSEAVFNEVKSCRPEAVVHLAAIAFIGHKDANEFYRVNLIGSRNLLTSLASASENLQSVLLVSSANVYGNASEGILKEDTPVNPANDYAVSKVAMELMAGQWKERLPLFIVRPFNFTGVGQSESFLLPKIAAHFRSRAPVIELGNLDVWRDFSDVRAVAEAYRRLLEVRPTGQTINVSSGRTHSLREVLTTAEELTGHSPEIIVNPAFVRENEVRTLCGDNSRLKSLIGAWESPPLTDTLKWMLDIPV